jgi:ABC-type Na+ efflux pump permease subunit
LTTATPPTPADAAIEAGPRGGRVQTAAFDWHRMLVVARTDLRQLLRSKDYLLPMLALGFLFFVAVPFVLLITLTNVDNTNVAVRISESLSILPDAAQERIQGGTPGGRTAYALAVFLFAPVAVVVPLTISTAVGAATIVGERERGTGEFLAHSPASTREIYMGKLIASVIPGYLTTIIGFGTYSLIVNLTVGPEVGGWFFPTREWWLMMLWIIPPFLLLTLSLVLRLSARVKSTAAAQQASGLITLPLIGLAYSQATGSLLGTGDVAGWVLGAVAWVVAVISLMRGVRSVTRNRLLGVAQ